MKFLQTKNCCGCANLRTGGLIIGFIVLFINVLRMSLEPSVSPIGISNTSNILSSIATILIWGTWLYGIYNQRTSWMLPALVCIICGLFAEIIVLIFLPIVGSVYDDEIQKFLNEQAKNSNNPNGGMSTTFLLTFLWLLFAIFTVIQWHVASVMYSLYKNMKTNSTNLNTLQQYKV